MRAAMSGIRLFVGADLGAGATVALDAGQAHYVRNVMRAGVGDPVVLFNGRDGEWTAALTGLGKQAAEAQVARQTRPQAPEPDVWLAFAPLKRGAVDSLVEKTTELGVARLLPVLTRRTNAARVNLDRLRAHAVEAAEQCERLSVPDMADPVRLDALTADWPPNRRLVVCDERGDAPPIAAALGNLPPGPTAVLVGPEGGFEGAELDSLDQLPFVTRVGLGPRVLRADTAALAALAIIQALAGDGDRRPE